MSLVFFPSCIGGTDSTVFFIIIWYILLKWNFRYGNNWWASSFRIVSVRWVPEGTQSGWFVWACTVCWEHCTEIVSLFSWTVYGVCVLHVVIRQGCTNSVCLVARVIKFRKVVPNIFSIIIEVPPSWYKICISSHVTSILWQITVWLTGHCRVCGSAMWILLHVSLLVPKIVRWLQNFWKIFMGFE